MAIRGGAPLLQGVASFAGLVWEPRLGAKLLRPARYLWGCHCSRRGAAPTGGRVVCWIDVGAPPRGEAVEAGSIIVGLPLFAAGRRSYRGGASFAGLVWEPRLGAKLLRPARYLWGSHCSRRGAAPTGVASFAGLVWESRLGAKLWGCVRDCGIAATVRGGAPLLRGRWRLLDWRGSPASGRSFGVAFGIVG